MIKAKARSRRARKTAHQASGSQMFTLSGLEREMARKKPAMARPCSMIKH
jgi:hypothetical protein